MQAREELANKSLLTGRDREEDRREPSGEETHSVHHRCHPWPGLHVPHRHTTPHPAGLGSTRVCETDHCAAAIIGRGEPC